jgi:hypothetical protein
MPRIPEPEIERLKSGRYARWVLCSSLGEPPAWETGMTAMCRCFRVEGCDAAARVEQGDAGDRGAELVAAA